MIFCHSGNIGDILYSLPCIKALCNEATLYIKPAAYELGNQYSALRDFLFQQDSIQMVLPFIPKEEIDWNWYRWPGFKEPINGEYTHDLNLIKGHDLDLARSQKLRGRVHIIKRYFDTFGIDQPIEVPFLKVDDLYKREERFALFSVSPRWNSYFYDWGKIYEQARQKYDNIYFIGFISEWLEFQTRYAQIEHLQTENILELARLIRDCDHIYLNQGPALIIAQGLGKNYSLLPNHPPGSFMRTNCVLGTLNETILKQDYSMIK